MNGLGHAGGVTVPEEVSVDAPALARPRLMTQRWRDVAFLHWAVDPDAVARFFPPGVRPDVLDGRTYVGLVPFRMVGAGFVISTLPKEKSRWLRMDLPRTVRSKYELPVYHVVAPRDFTLGDLP